MASTAVLRAMVASPTVKSLEEQVAGTVLCRSALGSMPAGKSEPSSAAPLLSPV